MALFAAADDDDDDDDDDCETVLRLPAFAPDADDDDNDDDDDDDDSLICSTAIEGVAEPITATGDRHHPGIPPHEVKPLEEEVRPPPPMTRERSDVRRAAEGGAGRGGREGDRVMWG